MNQTPTRTSIEMKRKSMDKIKEPKKAQNQSNNQVSIISGGQGGSIGINFCFEMFLSSLYIGTRL